VRHSPTQTVFLPLTPIDVNPVALTALKAYSEEERGGRAGEGEGRRGEIGGRGRSRADWIWVVREKDVDEIPSRRARSPPSPERAQKKRNDGALDGVRGREGPAAGRRDGSDRNRLE